MIRTFHSKINKKTLVFSLLPGTVLAVYFFWVRWPLAALCFMVFLVFVVERLIHTAYVCTDDGFLYIRQGRFSKMKRYALADIEKAEVMRYGSMSLLKSRDTVMLTFCDGSIKMITPFPAEEFCRYVGRRRDELLKDTN